MFNQRQGIGTALAVLLAASWLGTAAPARADDSHHGNAHVQSIGIPLTGSVMVSNAGTGCSTSESVSFKTDSTVNVKAVDNRNNKFIIVDLVDVSGTGATTHQTYLGEGSHKVSDVTFPSSGKLALPVLDFMLIHTSDGCADSKLPVTVTLEFSNGHLQSSSTAVAGP